MVKCDLCEQTTAVRGFNTGSSIAEVAFGLEDVADLRICNKCLDRLSEHSLAYTKLCTSMKYLIRACEDIFDGESF